MHSDFGFITHGGIELLTFLPWWDQGVVHGMTTGQLRFTGGSVSSDAELLKKAVGASHLATPLQCHGATVVDMRTAEAHASLSELEGGFWQREVGDALAAPVKQLPLCSVFAYGVLTADCVPIIVRGRDALVLIHAGWRGLAAGVIAVACQFVSEARTAVVFASAGADRYEVGSEVVESIGASAVYRESSHEKNTYLLDTGATAVRQLQAAVPNLAVHCAEVCTISDDRFHSYRRDGSTAGRGLTFVVPSFCA